MDKAEYHLKLQELTKYVEEQDYTSALKIVESVEWRRVKSLRTLNMVADVYEANRMYRECKNILQLAFDRASIGKSILYRLVEVCLKLGEIEEAVDYYTEFAEVAPHDNSRYILKYKIYRARRSPLQDQIAIVYTPLHGTGNIPARRVMKELGFEHVYVVPEQELPDGNFPTVSYPNPEAAEAFELGLKLAKEKNADLVLATDPDADRLGVYVKDTKSGEYIPLTGNMSGSLLCDYVLSQKKERGQIPADGQVVKSIVTTNLVDAVAEYYGAELIEVLTGFKWIGKQILKNEQEGRGTYLFGMEESYGCLIGTYARDKDAISATAALCEAAAYYKEKGMTLWDAMVAMYERYGYYKDSVQSIGLKGIEGLAKIQEIMEYFRNHEPAEFAGCKVLSARDYKADTIRDTATGEVKPTGLPSSNVLYYDLEDSAWLCVRPSGTEPKIKFYYGVKGTSLADADEKAEKLGKAVMDIVNGLL